MTSNNSAIGQDRRIRRTRNAIRSALTDLLTEMTIEQITIKDITARGDIGYTTFFRHFATKELAVADLARGAAEQLLSETLHLLRSNGSLGSCLALCRHIEENRAVWNALLSGGASSLVREAMIEQTTVRSHDWPNETSWLPREAGTALVTGLVIETITWWLSKAAELPPERVATIMDNLFISALVANNRPQG